MARFSFPQYEGEQFHHYFSRFHEFVENMCSLGFSYYKWELSRVIIEGMNPESWDLANYYGNGMILDMDGDDCYDLFCYISSQSLQAQSVSKSLQETFDAYMASAAKLHVDLKMMRDDGFEAQIASTNEIIAENWRGVEFLKTNATTVEYNGLGESCFSVGQGMNHSNLDLPIDLCYDDSSVVSSKLVIESNNDDLSYENFGVEELDDLLDDFGIDNLFINSQETELLKFDTCESLTTSPQYDNYDSPCSPLHLSSIVHDPTIVNSNSSFMPITITP